MVKGKKKNPNLIWFEETTRCWQLKHVSIRNKSYYYFFFEKADHVLFLLMYCMYYYEYVCYTWARMRSIYSDYTIYCRTLSFSIIGFILGLYADVLNLIHEVKISNTLYSLPYSIAAEAISSSTYWPTATRDTNRATKGRILTLSLR